jgi:hypothetical protein
LCYTVYRRLFSPGTLGMVKPRLPKHVEFLFPVELVRIINSYVPHLEKVPNPRTSPSLQRELTRIQGKHLAGKNAMYMRDLDDFILDNYDCY